MTNNTASDNTAVGYLALPSSSIGSQNTAVGVQALNNTNNASNTAVGYQALFENTTGFSNVAVGSQALFQITNGNGNIAIGDSAGVNASGSASDSIFIGQDGSGVVDHTIKVGQQGLQTSAFIAGIRDVTTGFNNAVAVVIDSNGQLGTINSSRRYKEDIHALADPGDALMKLRPVTFRYKKPFRDGSKPLQYGLIAEEVAAAMPGLAVLDRDGKPQTVKYHLLPTFLLAAYQRQQKTIVTQQEEIAALQRHLERLDARLVRSSVAHRHRAHRAHVAKAN